MGPAPGWGNRPYGYGRGWCWHPGWYGAPVPPWGPPTKEEEIRFLEGEAKFLQEELNQIEKKFQELKTCQIEISFQFVTPDLASRV